MPSSSPTGSGLKLAASLGLKASEPFPSLAPVRAASPVLKAVKGLRCRGRASLLADRKTVKQETGEIQFTDQGLSGICILNLSWLVGEFFSQNRQQAQNGESRALSEFSAGFGLFLAALIFAGADLRAAAPARGAAVIRNRQQAGWIGFAQTAHALRPFPALAAACPLQVKNDLPHCQGLALLSHGNPGLAAGSTTAGGLLSSQFESATLESKGLPGCMPAASFWISTETAAAIIYNGPGPPALSPGKAPRARCFLTHSLRQRRIPDFALSKPAPPSVSRGAGPLRLYPLRSP